MSLGLGRYVLVWSLGVELGFSYLEFGEVGVNHLLAVDLSVYEGDMHAKREFLILILLASFKSFHNAKCLATFLGFESVLLHLVKEHTTDIQ